MSADSRATSQFCALSCSSRQFAQTHLLAGGCVGCIGSQDTAAVLLRSWDGLHAPDLSARPVFSAYAMQACGLKQGTWDREAAEDRAHKKEARQASP